MKPGLGLALTALALVVGCGSDDGADRRPAPPLMRPLSSLPADELRLPPSPLEAPEEYAWADRTRFVRDLGRHVRDLDRRIALLRGGLRSASGVVPRDVLLELAEARSALIRALSRLDSARPESWERVRTEAYAAVERLDRVVLRARRAASSGRLPAAAL